MGQNSMLFGASKSPQSGFPPRQRGIFVGAYLASMARSVGKYPIPDAVLWTVSRLLAATPFVVIPSKESIAMSERTCKKCGAIKPSTDFYPHQHSECKECTKKRVRDNRAANLDYYQSFDRQRGNLPHRIEARKAYAQTDNGQTAIYRAKRAYIDRNPQKRAAHVSTGNAIARGHLIPKPCEVCGNPLVQAHHDDYNQPLNVRWLCPKHHAAYHKTLRSTSKM